MEAADFVLLGEKPVSALCQPTGSGKTLVPPTIQKLTPDDKMVILTSTKSLQDQYMDDLAEIGLCDIRGLNNYRCASKAYRDKRWYSCENGTDDDCPLAQTPDCPHYADKKKFVDADIGVTNYQFWMHSRRASASSLGPVGTLVLDEADEAFEELARFLTIKIKWEDVDSLSKGSPEKARGGTKLTKWNSWAVSARKKLKPHLHSIDEKDKREKREMKDLDQKLWWVEHMETGEWVWETDEKGVQFECIWPGRYTKGTLFSGVARIILISATVRPYTLKLLGIKREDYQFREWPKVFPLNRMPFIHVPTVAMTYRTSPEELELMCARVDQIIGDRLDRKGLIHTKSYERAAYLQKHSEYARYFLLNDSKNTRETAAKFRAAKAPCILVSPSYPRGWDFKYDACEYQIIVKVPFDVTTSQIAKQRNKDKRYMLYQVTQELVQMRGRGMRAEDDRCETIVLDNQSQWVVPLGIKSGMAPEWFSMRTLLEPPQPPPKLVR